ncbi:beta-defensin 105 isoform X8 [Lemur catta]|uniref:beta-defensin 105 isoform X8 n=1 Tax=Lemur catta TaxID=9447 RepID=UPI001E26AB92|nr:beta-defensin 105 isoform X8 [Lemur catta]
MSLLFSQRNPKRLSKESSTKMALSRKTLYFVFAFFFTLAQLPSGCQAGMDYPYSFPGGAGLDVQGRSGEVTCLLHVTQTAPASASSALTRQSHCRCSSCQPHLPLVSPTRCGSRGSSCGYL